MNVTCLAHEDCVQCGGPTVPCDDKCSGNTRDRRCTGCSSRDPDIGQLLDRYPQLSGDAFAHGCDGKSTAHEYMDGPRARGVKNCSGDCFGALTPKFGVAGGGPYQLYAISESSRIQGRFLVEPLQRTEEAIDITVLLQPYGLAGCPPCRSGQAKDAVTNCRDALQPRRSECKPLLNGRSVICDQGHSDSGRGGRRLNRADLLPVLPHVGINCEKIARAGRDYQSWQRLPPRRKGCLHCSARSHAPQSLHVCDQQIPLR